MKVHMSIEATKQVLTEGVIAQWEFHLSVGGISVQFDEATACPKHPGHVRVFFESAKLPDEDKDESPEHAFVVELLFAAENKLVVIIEYYNGDTPMVHTRVRPESLHKFWNDGAENIGQVMRLLRAMTPIYRPDAEMPAAMLH